MKIIDLHQDLLSHIRFRDELKQSHQTDFEMLEESTVDVVVATAFPLPKSGNQLDLSVQKLITEELQMYREHCAHSSQWDLVLERKDLDLTTKKLLLHVEGLNVFNGSTEHWSMLEQWYEIGLRSIATHWNINNQLGGGTLDTQTGLTELGREVINWAEDKNLLLDFAHMGRQTFEDAIEIVSRPVYVSHGNADSLCSNIRNYTDKQLKHIALTEGVIGVFFPNTFVVGKEKLGTIYDVIEHIKYIRNLIGIEHVALGTDFGGIISGTVTGLASVRDLSYLQTELLNSGFSENDVKKIFESNARRVIEKHLA